MSERIVVLQKLVNQRKEPPAGMRIWSDRLVQRPAADNPLPSASERLDQDREIKWQDDKHLTEEQLEAIRAAIREVGFFDLPPRMLINYCTDDPGTAIWIVNLDGQSARVVVFDPRPRRSAELDRLAAAIDQIIRQ